MSSTAERRAKLEQRGIDGGRKAACWGRACAEVAKAVGRIAEVGWLIRTQSHELHWREHAWVAVFEREKVASLKSINTRTKDGAVGRRVCQFRRHG